jgi:hypothetical protein
MRTRTQPNLSLCAVGPRIPTQQENGLLSQDLNDVSQFYRKKY